MNRDAINSIEVEVHASSSSFKVMVGLEKGQRNLRFNSLFGRERHLRLWSEQFES